MTAAMSVAQKNHTLTFGGLLAMETSVSELLMLPMLQSAMNYPSPKLRLT